MSLPGLSIRRPVATAMLFVAVAVLGVVSFARLPVALLPDVAFPTLAVSTTFPDAGPAEVERFVTQPIESQLLRVPGVREVTSRSRQGQSLVRLRFAWGTDMEFAMLHVRERLENLDVEEGGADRPTILRTDPSADPALTLAVTGRDLLQLRELSETVFKRRLEQLDGVALAAVTGGPEREVHVTVDPRRLASFGLGMSDVREALDRANYSAPGGRIQQGRFQYSLRTQGEFRTVAEIRRVTVSRRGRSGAGGDDRGASGGAIRLADVADVGEGFADRETLARYDGEPAVGMQVYQESGANTVRVADRVEEVLDQLRLEFGDVTIQTASSQATFIRNAISNVVQALVLGGLLAFLVLFLFLRDPRYPLAVGVSIPISILAAFGLFYLFDVSLNVMSLGGLALGVGMLVDNSIVVLENIFRHGEEGRGAERAAAWGAREVTAAITASTFTTIAVFGPVLYVQGVAGALFEDLSLSVTFSLLASLLVAVTLLPVLAARLAGGDAGETTAGAGPDDVSAETPGAGPDGDSAGAAPVRGAVTGDSAGRFRRVWGWMRWAAGRAGDLGRTVRSGAARAGAFVVESVRLTLADVWAALRAAGRRLFGPFLEAFDRGFHRFAAQYERSLEWSLEHRARVLGVALLSLALATAVGLALPRNVMPEVDEGRFRVELELPVGTPLEVTAETSDRIEALLLDAEGVEAVFTRVGRARGAELAARELSGLNSAAFEVRMADDAPPVGEVVARFREAVRGTGMDPGTLTVRTGQATSLGQALALTDADLAVRLQDDDLDRALAVADTVRARLAGAEGLADVRVDLQRTQPELEIEVRRQAAARHDLSVEEVADAVEGYLRGLETDRPFTQFAEKIGIRIRVPEARRSDLSEVLDLRVEGVPVREVVNVRQGYGPVEIRREGQARTVRVLADVTGGGLADAVQRVRVRTSGLSTPGETTLRVGGANEEMRESFRSLLFAFGLALCLVYLILAAQFESVLQPLVILAAVPLAAIGAVVALWLTGGGIDVMSGIGVVVLVGIVVNDAIVKVDFINQRRAAGRGLRTAIVEAGRLRLRPILMTTVTTVFGLLPLALGWGAGADLRAPLAVAVIGGLISSTALTLLVVPVLYDLLVSEDSDVRVRAKVPVEAAP